MDSNLILSIYGDEYRIDPTIPVVWLNWIVNELMTGHEKHDKAPIDKVGMVKTITQPWGSMGLTPNSKALLLKNACGVIHHAGPFRIKVTHND